MKIIEDIIYIGIISNEKLISNDLLVVPGCCQVVLDFGGPGEDVATPFPLPIQDLVAGVVFNGYCLSNLPLTARFKTPHVMKGKKGQLPRVLLHKVLNSCICWI